MKKASAGVITEVVRQLGAGEIDHDTGIKIVEHRLILPSGSSIREMQARRLFDLGFGKVLDCETFEQYLDAVGKDSLEPVPLIQVFPAIQMRLFGTQGITLVDGRVVEKIGFKEYLRLIGLAYSGEDDTFEAFDPERAKSGIRWMIGQDGYRNRNRKPSDCRESFAPFEVGMDGVEGGALYAQKPEVIDQHYLDLLGSVHREARGSIAYMGVFGGGPEVSWLWCDYAGPRCGAASRGE